MTEQFDLPPTIAGLRVARDKLVKLLKKEQQRSASYQEEITKLREDNFKYREAAIAFEHGWETVLSLVDRLTPETLEEMQQKIRENAIALRQQVEKL